jgi:Holliday junction resolvasome RuvABC endonuclease subunit
VILGVDPGLAHCGWAFVAGGALISRGVIKTARDRRATGDAQRRLAELCKALHGKVLKADLVVVEWPAGGGGFGRNAGAAAQTAQVAGAIAGLAWGVGRKVNAPASVTWRIACGAKRGQDELLHVALAARYAEDLAGVNKGDMPHVLDAIGLALYGEACTNPRAGAQLALVS